MIFTRFGNALRVISGDMDTGRLRAEFIEGNCGEDYEFGLCDLKADGGLKEIEQAITEANRGEAVRP